MTIVSTNVRWAFDFCQFWVFGEKKKIRLKEPLILDIKKFKEPPSFMKELEKTQQVLRQLFDFLKKLKSTVIYNNQVSDFFIITVIYKLGI